MSLAPPREHGHGLQLPQRTLGPHPACSIPAFQQGPSRWDLGSRRTFEGEGELGEQSMSWQLVLPNLLLPLPHSVLHKLLPLSAPVTWGQNPPSRGTGRAVPLSELLEKGASKVSGCRGVFMLSVFLLFQLGTLERYPDPWAVQVAPE